MSNEIEYKIAIVGGGMAGATAARKLLDKDINIKGQDILIIEPLDRVGGRTYKLTQDCDRIPNHPVDVGGAWICPEQKSVWRLCEEQGMEIVAQESPHRGMRADVMTQGGLWKNLLRMLRLVETKEEEEERMCKLYSLPAGDLIAYVSAGRKLDKLANEVIQDVKKPWLAKDAEMWDNLSVEDWLLKEVSNTAARGILRGIVLAVFCLPTKDYSMLMFLACLKIESFHMFTVGAQSHRSKQGFGSLVPTLMDGLKKDGVTIELGTKVVSCTQKEGSNGKVKLEVEKSGKKKVILASDVIVTVPPTRYRDITFEPKLQQMDYCNEMNMGKCIKTVLAYKERWWNETSGFADPLLGTPITLVFDVSHDNEPMLATFFYGDNAVNFSGDDKKELRKKEAIAGAQRLVGSDPTSPDERSFHPLSVVEGDWPSMPYICGGYAGVPPVGSITKHKQYRSTLATSVGNVHFAGTECSNEWAGYIEGAMLSGEIAAGEVAEKYAPLVSETVISQSEKTLK